MTDESKITSIDLLRNGAVQDAAVFCGETDDVLTDNGWQQMVKALDNKNDWDLIVTAKHQRCREFAELIASEDGIDIEVKKKFNEMDFGLWEGLSPEEIMKEDSDQLKQWWHSPTQFSPPNGEDFHAFQARILSAFKDILENNSGKKILFVADSGPIRLIIMYILGMQDDSIFRLNVDYGCLSQIEIQHDDNGFTGSLLNHG